MKGLIVAALLTGLLAPASFAREQERSESLLARVTVYWASGGRGSDRYTRQHKCATGMRLRDGHCAVDPKKIPYGSNIVFPDGTKLAAVDTGTAVRTRKAARLSGRTINEKNALVVDRFFETKRQALAWANTHPHFIPIRVIRPHQQLVSSGRAQPGALTRGFSQSPRIAQASVQPLSAGLQLPKIR
ncbi:MAG: hypothetical protein QOI34_1456 [Verrucomicrobiota bacterium]|jgi:3D (Asp-Asp-Asp) domain-containing protein